MAIPFAQHDHTAVSLGEQAKQPIEQFPQQRVEVEGAAKVAHDLEHHLQLMGRRLSQQRMVARRGVQAGADDMRGIAQVGCGVGTQCKGIRADLEGIPLRERRRLRHALAVQKGAVTALEILDDVAVLLHKNAGVLTTDCQGLEKDIRVGLAPDDDALSLQRKALAELRALETDE